MTNWIEAVVAVLSGAIGAICGYIFVSNITATIVWGRVGWGLRMYGLFDTNRKWFFGLSKVAEEEK